MSLPNSYSLKPNAIPDYFAAIRNSQPPQRFSQKFLEDLGFKSTNDRPVIGILKELGFLNTDGVPTDRYFAFRDKTKWQKVIAEGIREMYEDLFKLRVDAHLMSKEEVESKLIALYRGEKSDDVVGRIARTFVALSELGDFSEERPKEEESPTPSEVTPKESIRGVGSVSFDSLQYQINIVLPESRDQNVYDAIFRSLAEHLK